MYFTVLSDPQGCRSFFFFCQIIPPLSNSSMLPILPIPVVLLFLHLRILSRQIYHLYMDRAHWQGYGLNADTFVWVATCLLPSGSFHARFTPAQSPCISVRCNILIVEGDQEPTHHGVLVSISRSILKVATVAVT